MTHPHTPHAESHARTMAEPHCPRCRERGYRARAPGRPASSVWRASSTSTRSAAASCLHGSGPSCWGQRYVRIAKRAASRGRRHRWTSGPRSGSRRAGSPAERATSRRPASPRDRRPLQPGQHLELDLQPAPGERPIRVEVAVVRSVQSGRSDLQFVRVKDDGDARLRRFLAGREARPRSRPEPPTRSREPMKRPPVPSARASQVGRTHRNGMVEHAVSLVYVYPFSARSASVASAASDGASATSACPSTGATSSASPDPHPRHLPLEGRRPGPGTVRDISGRRLRDRDRRRGCRWAPSCCCS